jgi:uncharacterized protein (DUF2236 family)
MVAAADNSGSAKSDSVLPSAEEVPALVPRPGSPVWELAGDARLYAGAGYALLLQVAHPTVGAGVREHSNFQADPYGRLFRTLDYTYSMTYGGPRLAAEVGRRVREMHKQIKGVKPDGEPYHALEPEAYAWVHATLADAILNGHRRFGVRLSGSDLESFWAEWRRSGRLVGVRERDLPADWPGFRAYFDRMISERLERTDAVGDVLEALTDPAAPPLPVLGDRVWRVARVPFVRVFELATIGMLPPPLRRRLGVTWTKRQQVELRALGRAARAATPLMPRSLRNTGPAYMGWRREAIARGDVASGAQPARIREAHV